MKHISVIYHCVTSWEHPVCHCVVQDAAGLGGLWANPAGRKSRYLYFIIFSLVFGVMADIEAVAVCSSLQ